MPPNKPHHEGEKNEIEKRDGRSITFRPRALSIVWGADSRYWKLPNPGDVNGTADLVQVSWLEVTGTTEPLEPGKYEVSFKVSIKPDAFGWNSCQPFLMAKVGKKGKYNWKKVSLKDPNTNEIFIPVNSGENFSIEVKLENEDKQLYFGLYEVWSGKWKGGLSIHGAYVNKV